MHCATFSTGRCTIIRSLDRRPRKETRIKPDQYILNAGFSTADSTEEAEAHIFAVDPRTDIDGYAQIRHWRKRNYVRTYKRTVKAGRLEIELWAVIVRPKPRT
jgi:hypothetical protein